MALFYAEKSIAANFGRTSSEIPEIVAVIPRLKNILYLLPPSAIVGAIAFAIVNTITSGNTIV